MFGVSRAIIFRWQQKYDEGGPAALNATEFRCFSPAGVLSFSCSVGALTSVSG
jgi:hypothetical protein